MDGGQLELIKHQREKAIEVVCNQSYTDEDLVSVSYGSMGKCIMIQGCKVNHHVTEVISAKEDRISFIISLTPANAYQPGFSLKLRASQKCFRLHYLPHA